MISVIKLFKIRMKKQFSLIVYCKTYDGLLLFSISKGESEKGLSASLLIYT